MANAFRVIIDDEDKDRLKAYLQATYKGTMADFIRRVVFEKVSAWEALQREEQRKEEEHQARLAQFNTKHKGEEF
jgi:hypothetical protein